LSEIQGTRSEGIALQTAQGRRVLLATVLGSGMAFLDTTVVNVALPVLGRELGASVAGLQWTIDAYLLTLTAFLLLGGSLGDALGRRRMFVVGTAAFAATSALCGLAPSLGFLCAARALQGVAAALLVPGSLAILRTSLQPADQDAAIGAWAGLAGVMAAVGPIAGGWLIQVWSWRAIFFLNLPLAAVVIWTTLRAVPAHPQSTSRRLDGPGAALVALGLAGVVFALIEGPARGNSLLVLGAGCVGVLALAGFLVRERRATAPMLPLHLFRSRQFTTANLTTLTVYFALSAAMFLIVLALQRGLGYSPLASGLALLPITILMLVLSPIVGRVTHRIGYRVPMSIGPACAGLGLAVIALFGITPRGSAALLAGVAIFGVGLSLTVTPLTAAVMSGVPSDQAGTASGVNNAVARLASLLGVAVLPGLSGVGTAAASGPGMLPPIRIALGAAAAICAAGGLIAALGLRRPPAPRRPAPASP